MQRGRHQERFAVLDHGLGREPLKISAQVGAGGEVEAFRLVDREVEQGAVEHLSRP